MRGVEDANAAIATASPISVTSNTHKGCSKTFATMPATLPKSTSLAALLILLRGAVGAPAVVCGGSTTEKAEMPARGPEKVVCRWREGDGDGQEELDGVEE